MEEDDQIILRSMIPIADIVQFEVIAKGKEVVLEAWEWCFA